MRPYLTALLTLAFLFSKPSFAVNYHLVGWFNTFVPGGGEILRGNILYGLFQGSVETSSFLIGYHWSSRTTMTLDGVPEDLPEPSGSSIASSTSSHQTCAQYEKIKGKLVCTRYTTSSSSGATTVAADGSNKDITKALRADFLQEIGIKYHMVNVFNAYRHEADGRRGTQRIDQTSTAALFAAPFRPSVLSDPAVFISIGVAAAAVGASYYVDMKKSTPPLAQVNRESNSLYAFTYSVFYPVGSAAPEEMFYRGFLQNEFYSAFRTPLVSIPLQAAAYAFSHSAPERLSAAVTGLWEGILTHANKGQLSPSIAFHFWANVFSGLYTIALFQKAQYHPDPKPLVTWEWHF